MIRRIIVLIAMIAVNSIAVLGQSTVSKFEIASVKLRTVKPPPGSSFGPAPGGRFNAIGINVATMIIYAYDVKLYQISGATEWMYAEAYDIAAKAPTESTLTIEQVRPMLQALLADRFALKFHPGTKEMQVYALKIGKKGPKVKLSSPAATPSVNYRMGALSQMNFAKTSLPQFARALSNFADRPVIDRTNLKGNYDVKLEWNSDDAQPDSRAPGLFTAIQEQLGLKLEAQKGPVEMMLIDHAERPSEN